jgi:hypothetical protein
MKTITKFLTFIISFQLLWGCNSPGGQQVVNTKVNNPSPGLEESVQINGTIANVIQNISSLLFSSAHASEGKLYVYDISIPVDDPVILFTAEISGESDYSLKLKKSLIKGKLLKLKFDSYEGAEHSRDFIIEPGESETVISADMDLESTLKAKVLDAQLRVEYSSGKISNSLEVKERFRKYKDSKVDSELELLGDKAALIKLIFDPGFSDKITKMLATYRISSDIDKEEVKNKLFAFIESGEPLAPEHELTCSGNEGRFIMKGEQVFQVFAEGVQDQVVNEFGTRLDLGSISNSTEADERIHKLIQILTDVGSKFGDKFSATIYFVNSEKENEIKYSCLLSGQGGSDPASLLMDSTFLNSVSFKDLKSIDEGLENLKLAFEKTIEDLKNQSSSSKLSPDELAKAFEEQKVLVKSLYEERISLLTHYINALYAMDPVYLESVTFEKVETEEEGLKMLYQAYEKTLVVLKEQISSRGVSGPELDKIMDEQVPFAKKLLEARMEELRFTLGK